MDLGVAVDRLADRLSIAAAADRDVLLRDHQHAARAAARVVDGADRPARADRGLVARQHQVDHQVDDVAWREVLAGVLIQRLVELADQFLEDRAHRRVVDPVGVQVHVLEALEHLEQQPGLIQSADRVVEVESLEHLTHVLAEPGDVVAQIGGEVRRIGKELVEIVARGVVEGETGDLAELRVEILELAAGQLRLFREHLLLSAGKHAIEAAEHGQGEDDVLILAAFERVADEVRDTPEKADDLAVVHGLLCGYLAAGRIRGSADSWQETAAPGHVFGVRQTEPAEQVRLLAPGEKGECGDREQREEREQPVRRDHAERREHHGRAGVEWVPDPPVGSPRDELLAVPGQNRFADVRSEAAEHPQVERNGGRRDHRGAPAQPDGQVGARPCQPLRTDDVQQEHGEQGQREGETYQDERAGFRASPDDGAGSSGPPPVIAGDEQHRAEDRREDEPEGRFLAHVQARGCAASYTRLSRSREVWV